ncbi:MAG TPA: hypothetical protein VF818_02380 [Ktedonobacterales bacterium]
MIGAARGRQSAMELVLRVLVVVNTAAFLLVAPLHLGLRVPLGFAVLSTDNIVPAAIVEGLAGLGFAVSAYAVLARKPWAWPAAIAAHAFALGGVLLGIWTIAAGLGPHSVLNDIFHRVILVVLVVGIALLLTPGARVALGYRNTTRQR